MAKAESKRKYSERDPDKYRAYQRECPRNYQRKYYATRAERWREYQQERSRCMKVRAVEYLGGQCVDCGLKTDVMAVYDFDHRNPSEKLSNIPLMWSWKRIQVELDKCDLRCANCHRIRHARERDAA